MKRGMKIFLPIILLLMALLVSYSVFSSGHIPGAGGIDIDGASPPAGVNIQNPNQLAISLDAYFGSHFNIGSNSGLNFPALSGVYRAPSGLRASVNGVSHVANEVVGLTDSVVKRAVYSDYLKTGGTGSNTKLLGYSTITEATYVVPLIFSATCNQLCSYTLGVSCKGVATYGPTGGRGWAGLAFNSTQSTSQKKLVLAGSGINLCNTGYDFITA